MSLKEQLSSLLEGEVEDDPITLEKYSHDASIFEITPKVVVHPKNSQDIEKLIRFVNSHPNENLSVAARSAGTDMGGGSLTESIMIEMMPHFNKIKEIGTNFAVTQPGVYYRDFEKETLKHGLLFPSYPASREICAMGGIVSNNSGGEKSLTYGKTANYVQRLKIILSDGNEYVFEPLSKAELGHKMKQKDFEGEVYRKVYKIVEDNYDAVKAAKPDVSKNSAGYNLWDIWDRKTFDMTKLLVGSQGTLGIVTEAKLGLIHPKKHSKMLVIFLKDMSLLVPIIHKVLPFTPESFESYDDHTFSLALKYLPEIIKIMKPKNLFSMAIQFIPEMWMLATGGLPKLVMIAEFAGDSEPEVKGRAELAQKALVEFNIKTSITKNDQESKKYWVMRRESFNLLRHHIKDKKSAPFIDDMVVKPDYLPEFLPKLNQILSKYDLIFTMAGHIGDGNFHIIPLMNLKEKRNHEIIPELEKKVNELIFQYHGSMTGEHNDGLIRGEYLPEMYGKKIYGLFLDVKNAFDPHNIINPGKKVNVDHKFVMDHIQTH